MVRIARIRVLVALMLTPALAEENDGARALLSRGVEGMVSLLKSIREKRLEMAGEAPLVPHHDPEITVPGDHISEALIPVK